MTKYILNSGGLSNQPELTKKFDKEIVKDLGKNPKILFCLFAVPREDWADRFEKYRKRFVQNVAPEVMPEIELAFPDKFVEQVSNTDALIITGGDDHLLKYWLSEFDIPKIWEGKVVASSSAGSDALSKYYWTCDWRQNLDGFNILPIKFLPHFKSAFGATDPRGPIDWDTAYQELRAYKEDLPIYALEEGQYVIINS